MTLINLTPHPIRVYENATPDRGAELVDGLLFTVPPAEKPARIAMIDLGTLGYAFDETSGRSTWIDWQQFGQCHDMPVQIPGTTYIVSLVVALSLAGRDDVIFPVAEVRNAEGTVIGCRGFGRVC